MKPNYPVIPHHKAVFLETSPSQLISIIVNLFFLYQIGSNFIVNPPPPLDWSTINLLLQ